MLTEIFLELIIGEVVSGKTVSKLLEGVYGTETSAPIPRGFFQETTQQVGLQQQVLVRTLQTHAAIPES